METKLFANRVIIKIYNIKAMVNLLEFLCEHRSNTISKDVFNKEFQISFDTEIEAKNCFDLIRCK